MSFCHVKASVKGFFCACLPTLKLLVFGASDDLVLKLGGHVVEVVGVASNADEEVFVVVRLLLSVEKCLSVNDVELDVVTSHAEICADERYVAADVVWSGVPRDLMTDVGPLVSAPCAGDVPSEMANFAKRPLHDAPQTEPK